MPSRIEQILAAILSGDDLSALPEPESRIEALLTGMARARLSSRVTPLASGSALAGDRIIEVIGEPAHLSDVSAYSDYGLAEPGWYAFSRILAPDGERVTASTTVTGAAGYIAEAGADHIDVAVRFEVAATSKTVTIVWETGGDTDAIVFRATDMAIRNLDYRVTFYIYDIDDYVSWSYALTTDETFADGKNYYVESGGAYTLAEVTGGEAVPAYYTLAGGTYTQATGVFAAGTTYYTRSGETYSEATVTEGQPIPAYYTHSKITFSGMTRNVTYKFDQIIDCPVEIVLPEVEDVGYGAWFEIQLRYNDSYSCTLLPPEGVKIGTVSTQGQTAGINVIDLQYTGVGGVQMWSLLNTHSSIPE